MLLGKFSLLKNGQMLKTQYGHLVTLSIILISHFEPKFGQLVSKFGWGRSLKKSKAEIWVSYFKQKMRLGNWKVWLGRWYFLFEISQDNVGNVRIRWATSPFEEVKNGFQSKTSNLWKGLLNDFLNCRWTTIADSPENLEIIKLNAFTHWLKIRQRKHLFFLEIFVVNKISRWRFLTCYLMYLC